ncbi:hypothetical protein [Schaalia sp. lx-260]|uniref:hypothetical protein n=1 Tax=Schaalia sp. lx-260 TaxID=2899082 RepID=UPI001E47B1EA|nr:hypothetical protein [Schaalia sp. lx-260]MCD4549971.1 hypothetical protein [Schaalia sp. lx-260]
MGHSGASRKKRRHTNLWPRRIITGIALLVIIALVGAAIWWTVVAARAYFSRLHVQSEAAQSSVGMMEERTPDGIVGADGRITVPSCQAADVTVETVAQETTVGTGEKVVFRLTNKGQTACVLQKNRYSAVISSGTEVVFDGRTCEKDEADSTPLLLSVGTTWEGTLMWDGRRYAGCSAYDSDSDGTPDTAPAGAYHVQVHDGQAPVGSDVYFEVK